MRMKTYIMDMILTCMQELQRGILLHIITPTGAGLMAEKIITIFLAFHGVFMINSSVSRTAKLILELAIDKTSRKYTGRHPIRSIVL